MRQPSFSYTKSQWGYFIERVRILHNQGKSISYISKELNVSEGLIDLAIKTQINKSH